jgi:hypothetical protein
MRAIINNYEPGQRTGRRDPEAQAMCYLAPHDSEDI